MKLTGTWNRIKYKLLGSPKYCKDCGRELEWDSFGGQWDKHTGKHIMIYVTLGCSKYITRGHHTHIYFDERVDEEM